MPLDRTSDKFLEDAYTGLGGFVTGEYLVSHNSETPDAFTRRKELAVYTNFVRKIVDIHQGFLWRKPPAREGMADFFPAFAASADDAGHSLDYLMASYQRLATLLGSVYVVVDKPKAEAKTRADEGLPYLMVRRPSDALNAKTDAAGRWTRITFAETLGDATVYRTYLTDGWLLSEDADGTRVIEQGAYNLGRVPVARLHSAYPLLPTDTRARSWAFDVIQLNWELYNLESGVRALFRDQEFSIFLVPVADPQERDRLKTSGGIVLGTQNGLVYDPTGGASPSYLAPPDGPVQQHAERIAAIIFNLYRLAHLEFVGGVQQSGVALSYHFQQCNSSLATRAELCESADIDVLRLTHAWMGVDYTGEVRYARDFNLSDPVQEMERLATLLSLNISPTCDASAKKLGARQYFGNQASPETLAAIDEEIDGQGDPYGDRIQHEANSGVPTA